MLFSQICHYRNNPEVIFTFSCSSYCCFFSSVWYLVLIGEFFFSIPLQVMVYSFVESVIICNTLVSLKRKGAMLIPVIKDSILYVLWRFVCVSINNTIRFEFIFSASFEHYNICFFSCIWCLVSIEEFFSPCYFRWCIIHF